MKDATPNTLLRLGVLLAACLAAPLWCADLTQYAADLRQAEQMLSQGNFEGVIETLKSWPEKLPNRPEARHFLGLAAYQLKDFPGAIGHLSAALKLETRNSDAWKQTVETLGAACYFDNRWKEATPLLEQAAAWRPENSDLLYTLGMSYMLTRNSDGARRTFAKIFNVASDSPQAYLLTAGLMRKESLDADADALVQEARRQWPDARGVALQMATVAANEGDQAQAAALIREELSRYPGDAASWHALGEALAGLGHPDQAAEALKRAIWLDTGATSSYVLLAKLYMDADRYSLAEDTLRQALKLSPKNYEANFLLGRLYHKTGRVELARKQLAIAEQLSH